VVPETRENRFPARLSRELLLRRESQPKPIREIAWNADSGGSRPRIRDGLAQHSDLISLSVPG
jgi:hypothetical protein